MLLYVCLLLLNKIETFDACTVKSAKQFYKDSKSITKTTIFTPQIPKYSLVTPWKLNDFQANVF